MDVYDSLEIDEVDVRFDRQVCHDVDDSRLEQRECASVSVGEAVSDADTNDTGLMRVGISGTASSGLYITVTKDELDDRLLGDI